MKMLSLSWALKRRLFRSHFESYLPPFGPHDVWNNPSVRPDYLNLFIFSKKNKVFCQKILCQKCDWWSVSLDNTFTVGHHFFLQICLPYIWIGVSDLTNLPIFLLFSIIAQEAKFKFLLSIRKIIAQTTKTKPQTSSSSRSSFTTRHRILVIKLCISRTISPVSDNYTANHRERDSTFQFYHFNM